MVDYETKTGKVRNFVTADQDRGQRRRDLAIRGPDPAPIQVVDTSAVYMPMQTIQERTNSVDRAKGFILRTSVLYVYEFLLGLTVAGLAAMVGDVGVAMFALITLGVFVGTGVPTFVVLHWQDLAHSSAGVERLRINRAADVEKHRIDRETALRGTMYRDYVRYLENSDSDD